MRRANRRGEWRAVLGVALAAASMLAAAADSSGDVERGRALFHGETDLSAHLRGDPTPLPASAVRCINCHTRTSRGEAFAPPLTADSLRTLSPRRGGPPTAYDRDAFCSALANSIDVANVVLVKAMPQYLQSDSDCSALWAYLMTQ
ncbi:hypothetical protein UB46_12825 [Burkholderiaceae bacterium 16]|nr:hypothetical protein UB46_12825 [Burkholderiaceae bacterium 16]